MPVRNLPSAARVASDWWGENQDAVKGRGAGVGRKSHKMLPESPAKSELRTNQRS
jgi:hypothetical protein